MTLRTYFLMMGSFTFLPSALFLLLHRTGDGPKWVSRALRALAAGFMFDGFRLMVSNARRLDQPLVFLDNFDRYASVITITGAAVASCFFFAVYSNVRRWWDQ